MPRIQQTARKRSYITIIPDPKQYSWREPKAQCVLLDKPLGSITNSRSPKPLFYQPKDSTKSYLIITPYKKMRDQSTHFIYKYDIKANTYIKFSEYPNGFDVDWPMHFIDYNTDILYIFDSNERPKNGTKKFWKLNLINATWTNIQIPMNTHTFKPRGDNATISYSDNNKSVNIYHSYLMDSFNFESKLFQTKNITNNIRAVSSHLEQFPNGTYWKLFELKNVPMHNVFGSHVLFVFDHILFFIFDEANLDGMQIWCLDLLRTHDATNKWYKSNKHLPSYMNIYHMGSRLTVTNQHFIPTYDGYLHFYHQYFYHSIISLNDVVPKEITDNHCLTFEKLTFGYVNGEIEQTYNLTVPYFLKKLIFTFYTAFHV